VVLVTTSPSPLPQPLLPIPQQSSVKEPGGDVRAGHTYPWWVLHNPDLLTRDIVWTLNPSLRWRLQQDGEGADPGAPSHQLGDAPLHAAINISRSPHQGPPQEMRNHSLLERGNSKPFLQTCQRRQDVGETLPTSGMKQKMCIQDMAPGKSITKYALPTTNTRTILSPG
jgi:hypothetical protein